MAGPKKGWPLLTYEKHLITKIGEILLSPINYLKLDIGFLFTSAVAACGS